MAHSPDYDVIIIGGGPAGSALGAYLGRGGAKCAILEREIFPRPHVGESLVPACNRVLAELDLMDQMEAERFPHKLGAVWTQDSKAAIYSHDWGDWNLEDAADISFAERAMPGVDKPYTYHVDRGRFDLLLLKNAERAGAKVFQGVAVRGATFEEGGPVRVRCALGEKEVELTARMLVDASGRRTLMGTQLGWKTLDPVFNQYALHTWFDGFDRTALAVDKKKVDYIFVHFLPATNSWIWQIPITDTITSIGVVTQKEHFAKKKESREQFFWDAIGSRPKLLEALRASKQVRPLTEEGDYSYAMKELTGDRLVLIGDAGRFVDPIFSSGVSIALNSARLAAPDILQALKTGDFSKQAFANFEATIRRGTRNWYTFISLYYRLNVLFTYFVSDPEHRLETLKLLQGDMYDEEEPAVLGKMRAIIEEVEKEPDHPWYPLLGGLTAKTFKPAA
ncbi:MAG: tryptophan 7-halogenase [Myxococcota bacterium]|nr:tryptophan 7-halogenase [Myxococcota bacterium]